MDREIVWSRNSDKHLSTSEIAGRALVGHDQSCWEHRLEWLGNTIAARQSLLRVLKTKLERKSKAWILWLCFLHCLLLSSYVLRFSSLFNKHGASRCSRLQKVRRSSSLLKTSLKYHVGGLLVDVLWPALHKWHTLVRERLSFGTHVPTIVFDADRFMFKMPSCFSHSSFGDFVRAMSCRGYVGGSESELSPSSHAWLKLSSICSSRENKRNIEKESKTEFGIQG